MLPLDPRAEGTTVVDFESTDGLVLEGRVFGSGPNGVILSHMGSQVNAQNDWWPVAPYLAAHGYRVLTFNFRGICYPTDPDVGCSEGAIDFESSWKDLLGAIEFMRSEGVTSLTLMGASLGAMASLHVSGLPDVEVAGVVSVSGVEDAAGYDLDRGEIRSVDEPKLFIAGDADEDAARAYEDWTGWATEPSSGLLLDTDLHGTFIFDPIAPSDADLADRAKREVLAFLDRYA